MMLLGMKMCLALLWGISVFFAMESTSAPILETSTINSTAEPHKPHTEPHRATEISVVAAAETTVPPARVTEEAFVTHRSEGTNDTTSDLVAMNTVTTTTSSTDPRLLHTATAATAAAAHPSHNMTISETATPTEYEIRPQAPTTSSDLTAPAAATATASAAVAGSSLEPTYATKPEVTSKLSPTTFPANSTQAPVFIRTLGSPSASTTTTVTANPTSEAAPVFGPTINATSTTSTDLLSTPESVSSTRTLNTTAQFPGTAVSRPTAEPSTVSFSTESPISTTNVSTTIAVSTTNASTTIISATNVSATIAVSTTNVSTTTITAINVSTSPAAILIPHTTERLPVPTNKSTTAASCEASKTPPRTEVQPCSTRGVAKHCLIAIASLGALATVFMVSTIILCTRLSARKYKVKKPQPATEMMCISALLPERNYTYTRERTTPVTNGILVIHNGADSDEDGGDNLTLSSFLPENDRFV